MKPMKYIFIILLVIVFVQPTLAKKRVPPHSISTLTDPASPSYVPVPYPKNRKEIITDLLYYIERKHALKEGVHYSGHKPKIIDVMLNLLEEKPIYVIGKIFKIKNLEPLNKNEYAWHCLIEDLEGRNVMNINIHKDGLFSSAGAILPEHDTDLDLTESDVINIVMDILGIQLNKKQILSIERYTYGPGSIGDAFAPAWQIVLKNGKTYYYSIYERTVYSVRDKKKRKIMKNGYQQSWRKLVPRDADGFIFNHLDDEIITLKKHKKNK